MINLNEIVTSFSCNNIFWIIIFFSYNG